MFNNLIRSLPRRTALSTAITACLLPAAAMAQTPTTYTQTDIATNALITSSDSVLYNAINDSGTMVGSFYNNSAGYRATLGTGTTVSVKAYNVYGFSQTSGGTLNFFAPKSSNSSGLSLGLAGSGGNDITGINSSGQMVGWAANGATAGAPYSFITSTAAVGTTTSLSTLTQIVDNTTYSTATLNGTNAQGINDNGLVVGYNSWTGAASTLASTTAFIYNSSASTVDGIAANTYVDVNLAGTNGASTEFFGINNAGLAVGEVTTATGVSQGLLYNVSTSSLLDTFTITGATSTVVTGINAGASGTTLAGVDEIVGYWVDSSSTSHGFVAVWSGSTLTFLNQQLDNSLADSNGTILTGINDSGTLLGNYSSASTGNITGFTATANVSAVPVPGAFWFMGSALATLSFTARRKPRLMA